MANSNMIKFYRGLLANLPATGENGALYITTDEGSIYYGTGTGMKRLGDYIMVDAIENLPTDGANATSLYYCVKENVLCRYDSDNSKWVQINKQPTAEEMKTLLGLGSLAYKSEVAEGDLNADLAAKINAASGAQHTHDNKALLDTYTQTEADLADAVAKKHSHTFTDADVEDAISKEHTHTFADADVEDAISKKHAHTFVESELNKIAAGDVAKWNGVVADHLVGADKTELADAIGDVNTALENYKTSNNEALAGVKATADAAATKEYADAELAKKVAKTDYEADKATFATKTELNGVDAKFANYKTAADQKLIDDAQDVEIGKKVDKVEGKDLIATSEIERLATLKNYDDTALAGRVSTAEGKITALEGASATHALKSEVEAVDAKFADYTKTADLPTDLGDFTNNAGYAKTADVNAELDKKADKTQVATDIANAIAPLATTEALNGVKATAEAATTVEEVDAQIDAKIDALKLGETYEPIGAEKKAKDYVDQKFTDANLAQYTTEAEVKSIVDGVIAGAADSETYNSLTKLVDYIDAHGGEASEMAQAIETLEGDVKGLKEAPSAGIKASDIEAWNGEIGAKALAESKTTTAEVKAQIEAYGYATTGYADGKAAAAQSAAEAKAAELDAALKAELQGEIDADVKVVADDLAGYKTSNNAEVAKKANAADVYAKNETFTKDEVNAAIAVAVEQAHTWGSF